MDYYSNMTFSDKLFNYLKASYPLLWIRTHEEARICNDIINTFKQREKILVFEWDNGNGLVKMEKDGSTAKVKGDTGIKDIIKFVRELGGDDERCVIIFKDFHPYIEAPGLVRDLRNSLDTLKAKGNMIIFVSPIIKIPVELDKDIQLLDYALPSEQAIGDRITHVKSSAEKNSKDKLVLSEDIKQAAIEAAKGMTASEVENAFTLALVTHKTFTSDYVLTVFREKVQQVKKGGLLQHIESDVDFTQVGGLDALKDWMKVRSKAYSSAARKFGLPYPKGALLCGVPGCGKSLIAKATAREFGFPLFQLDVGALFGKHVGETEENFRRVVDTVEGIGRCILYIDEIEKALNKDAVSGKGDTGTSSRSFGTLLTWLSDHKSPVFVIGTSNNHTILPPEMTRKGRFDEMFWIDLPDEQERKDIFKVILSRYGRDPKNFKLDILAKKSKEFTGSEIENVVISAMFKQFAADAGDINNSVLEDECNETIPLAKTSKADLEDMRQKAEGKLRIACRDGVTASFEKKLRNIDVTPS